MNDIIIMKKKQIFDEKIKKNNIRNNSIDAFRVICAVMIVSIHTSPFYEINQTLGLVMSKIIPRIAVPFFFCTTGYYYINKLKMEKRILFPTLWKLIKIYSLWSFIYFAKDFIRIYSNNKNISIWLLQCMKKFFVYGSTTHLWYFPAIIFCIIITTIFNKYNKLHLLVYVSIVLYIVGCLGDAYYAFGSKIYFIRDLIKYQNYNLIRTIILYALPSFLVGYFLNKYKNNILKVKISKLKIALSISILVFLIEIITVLKFDLSKSITITIFLYPLLICVMCLLIKNPIKNININTRYFHGISSFMYYSHPLFFTTIPTILEKSMDIKISNTLIFILTVLSTSLVSIVIIKINNKNLNILIS
ncbi:acyltransferase [Clostridium intestinale]|uniref:acyltransferase family protein n=1 Tax=Clostridium intestinale TaxID=36845 RepID=UPI0028EDA670|nr:acyltransferase [Clostridium intestinale]